MTFNELAIDFGTGTFAHGQAYVALSRLKSLEGLCLQKVLKKWVIKVDKFLNTSNILLNENDLNIKLTKVKEDYNF